MAKFAPASLRVPDGFPELLTTFSREVLREQPNEIINFAVQHFQQQLALRKANPVKPTTASTRPTTQQTVPTPTPPPPRQPSAPQSRAASSAADKRPTSAVAVLSNGRPASAARQKTPAVQHDESPAPVSLPMEAVAAVDVHTFDTLEAEFKVAVGDQAIRAALWASLDTNGNGVVSLSEIDAWVAAKYPLLNHKPALMRAYKRTIAVAGGGDGDDWVERHEFKALLINLLYFNKLWAAFDGIDTDDDRRIDVAEFQHGLKFVGLSLPDEEAAAVFATIDTNGGGKILFDEFCVFVAVKHCGDDYAAESHSLPRGSTRVTREVPAPVIAPQQQEEEEEEEASPAPAPRASLESAPAYQPDAAAMDAAATETEAKDDYVEVAGGAFSAVEATFKEAAAHSVPLSELWAGLDHNGNGFVSLAEIDKWVEEQYSILNNKPALMRAYKRTISAAGGGDGDDWVERHEFKALLINLLYFNKAWAAFDGIDTDDDRRIDVAEFQHGLKFVGLSLPDEEAAAVFAAIDTNGGGKILFDEFCVFVAVKHCGDDYAAESKGKSGRLNRRLASTAAVPGAPETSDHSVNDATASAAAAVDDDNEAVTPAVAAAAAAAAADDHVAEDVGVVAAAAAAAAAVEDDAAAEDTGVAVPVAVDIGDTVTAAVDLDDVAAADIGDLDDVAAADIGDTVTAAVDLDDVAAAAAE